MEFVVLLMILNVAVLVWAWTEIDEVRDSPCKRLPQNERCPNCRTDWPM